MKNTIIFICYLLAPACLLEGVEKERPQELITHNTRFDLFNEIKHYSSQYSWTPSATTISFGPSSKSDYYYFLSPLYPAPFSIIENGTSQSFTFPTAQAFYDTQLVGNNVPTDPILLLHYKWRFMYMAQRTKFKKYPKLRKKLINTRNKTLVYRASPVDDFWGVDNNKGYNYLGIILMIIRDQFQKKIDEDTEKKELLIPEKNQMHPESIPVVEFKPLVEFISNYKTTHLKDIENWNDVTAEHFYNNTAPYQFIPTRTTFDLHKPFEINGKTYYSLQDYFTRLHASLTLTQKLKAVNSGQDLFDMYEGIKAQLEQHPDLQNALVKTGDTPLIYNDEKDSYWGIDYDGTGKNYIGIIYMLLRKAFKNQQSKRLDQLKNAPTKKSALTQLSLPQSFRNRLHKIKIWFSHLFSSTSNAKDIQ